jgi:GDP-L-fucose synthase
VLHESGLSVALDAPVFISGHRGFVGSALCRLLKHRGCTNLLTIARQDLDLRDQQAVDRWFAAHCPAYVIHAAGLVGGIVANSRRQADFLYDNVMMQATVLHAACKYGVTKLLNLGSSCVYPRDCPQPIREEYLLTGPLEPTNSGYAIAKIVGIKACEAFRQQYGCRFISCMPPNLYGPGDNFDRETSHVLPGLIRRFDEARLQGDKTVRVWGTGRPKRELLYVDDLADACWFLLNNYDDEQTINVGPGEELRIAELAKLVRDIVYPDANIEFDPSKPDGTPRKLLDCSRIRALGWKPTISLAHGVRETFRWYSGHRDQALAASN